MPFSSRMFTKFDANFVRSCLLSFTLVSVSLLSLSHGSEANNNRALFGSLLSGFQRSPDQQRAQLSAALAADPNQCFALIQLAEVCQQLGDRECSWEVCLFAATCA